jgi:hypothetical protein
MSVLLSGSRNQNIGGTGSPMRATSASTTSLISPIRLAVLVPMLLAPSLRTRGCDPPSRESSSRILADEWRFALNDPLHVGRKRGARSEHHEEPFRTTRIAAARLCQNAGRLSRSSRRWDTTTGCDGSRRRARCSDRAFLVQHAFAHPLWSTSASPARHRHSAITGPVPGAVCPRTYLVAT